MLGVLGIEVQQGRVAHIHSLSILSGSRVWHPHRQRGEPFCYSNPDSQSDTNFFHRVVIFGCCTRAVDNGCFCFVVLNVFKSWSLLGDRTFKNHSPVKKDVSLQLRDCTKHVP